MAEQVTTRHSILESIQKAPGCCAICRNIVGPFVDPGIQIQYHGALVFCETCIVEMYTALKGTPEPVVVRVPQNEDEINDAVELVAADLRSAIANLVSIRAVASAVRDEAEPQGDGSDSEGSAKPGEQAGKPSGK